MNNIIEVTKKQWDAVHANETTRATAFRREANGKYYISIAYS